MRTTTALATCALLALTGCSAISALGGATATLDVYELRAADQRKVSGRGTTQLTVETPTTTGALATDRIMIQPSALQAQYLPGARWSDPAPAMLQTLMLRSLESTNAFSYVGRRPIGPGGDFALLTELVDFQAVEDAEDGSVTVQLRMIVRLLREGDARIVATGRFNASAIAPSTETEAIIAGFDAASQVLMREFTDWTLSSIGRR